MEAQNARRTYRGAGVDIDAGNDMVRAIGPLVESTRRPGSMGGIGGFAGLFDPKAAGYRDPLLLATTDGVGTKVKLAATLARYDTIGIDLVAMCVNDLVVQGAEPLFFLDYFATARLDPAIGADVVAGIAMGCREAGCALVGGETAEMPGVYASGDFDLAGFAVGAVERDQFVSGTGVADGDVVLGLPSSGLHSNGFSLMRRVVDDLGLDLASPPPFPADDTLGAVLLTPTRIYVRPLLAAFRTSGVRAAAHITGGGLIENLPRVLPPGTTAVIDAAAWSLPPVFTWLASEGGIAPAELARTFNCGIGMAVVVPLHQAQAVEAALADEGQPALRIGHIERTGGDEPSVRLDRLESWSGSS